MSVIGKLLDLWHPKKRVVEQSASRVPDEVRRARQRLNEAIKMLKTENHRTSSIVAAIDQVVSRMSHEEG